MDHLHAEILEKIFLPQKEHSSRIRSRESTWLEFKETFSFGNLTEYARTMAAFANRNGGYIVFGVKNNPRDAVGIDNNKFQSIDSARLAESINNLFSPEIKWEITTYSWQDREFGILYTYESEDKPILSRKSHGEIKEADIYYRYNGRTENIKFSELYKIISQRLESEKNAWLDVFKRTANIGPQNVAVLDTLRGKIEGEGGTVIIDEGLLSQLKFIKKGEFNEEKGAPTLKLVGELKSAPVVALRDRRYVVGTDIYKYRPQMICEIVSKSTGKVFRPGSEHLKAWKVNGVRPNGIPKDLPFKNEFCEYKEADGNYRYSQAWVDLLVTKYANDKEYENLIKVSPNLANE